MQCQIRLLKKTSIPKVQRQCIQNMTGIVKVQWSEEQIRLKLKERVLQLSDECLAFITLDLCHLELSFSSLLICAFFIINEQVLYPLEAHQDIH